MIIALAGRRIDVADAESPRFPERSLGRVAEDLEHLFRTEGASAIVCSAACGADLVALREAGLLGLRRRLVLPFDAASFRQSSVIDRPGDWGPLFDAVVTEVGAGDLVVLGYPPGDDDSYAAANTAILDEAEALSRLAGEPVCAVTVWEGRSRGEGDSTQAFGDAARTRGLRVCPRVDARDVIENITLKPSRDHSRAPDSTAAARPLSRNKP